MIVFAIHGWEKKSITFKKYVTSIQVGTYKIQPKIFEIEAKMQNKNPKDKINGITGKIKILVTGATKETLPKLNIISGNVKIWAAKVTEIISGKKISKQRP